MAQIPDRIKQLIDTFSRNIDSYKTGEMNETQLRRQYIDPLFTELGWDVENKKGYASAYKDVSHEYSLKTKDVREAPDYCFRIGQTPKFFLEAKKPSVNVKEDIHPAFQVRSYAWSAKLPLSILTDFEEFAVYDCRIPPHKNDKASTARVMYFTYDQYIEKWEEITEIFSREAILKGSFDKYIESNKKKKGTAEVDSVFLDQMEEWRKLVARNIALRNPSLSIRELNFVVQKTIDRIIFLRICEDRGIEDYGQLMALQNGSNVYDRLKGIYDRADEKYNSGLFHFSEEKERGEAPDNLSHNLTIDDKVLKDIFKQLYYPDSPYEFSVLPADILGQVYEQFLGKIIRLTPTHQAVIEDKPEVKKAGGVYYTPTYIVDYIVQNTVGKLLHDIKLKDAAKIKILDPACGSGSFLIGAFQYLLNWHLGHYTSDDDAIKKYSTQKQPAIYQASNGDWLLTTSEKRRVLLNNIHGVDIDSQAVEVTKLSLLLKVLEGESEQTISNQMKFFRERALPDLSNNIKCGNSLIGPDFYDQMEMQFLDDEEKLRINVFDWRNEFKEIIDAGGFDAVIGNPPYVRQELIGQFKEYFEKTYKVYHGVADLYSYFIERAVDLLREGGYFSYIVANKWMRTNYGEPLRKWLKDQNLVEIVDFGDLPVFKTATTYPCIITISKGRPSKDFKAAQIESLDFTDLREKVNATSFNIDFDSLNSSGWSLVSNSSQALLDKLFSQGIPLLRYVNKKIFYGVKTGLNKAFVIDEDVKNKLISEDNKSAEVIKPFLAGRDIKRYITPASNKYLILIPKGFTNKKMKDAKSPWKWLNDTYPVIAEHLSQFEADAKKRSDQGEYWWELRACDYYDEFEKPKIMLPDISLKGNFSLDAKGGSYCVNTAYIIGNSEKYLLGILNSNLITFIYSNISSTYRGGYLRFIYQYLAQLPIVNANNSVKEKIETLVDSIIFESQRLLAMKTPAEKSALQRQINATDKKIDQLVYQLYGLTDEEIRIVEGN